MDFFTSLPLTKLKHDTIWAIVYRLTKIAHFIPANLRDTLDKLAYAYIREVVRLHGVPNAIVSDRDPRFIARFGIHSKRPWEINFV